MNEKAGRNDPCPCGSGKKYKQCCWGKEIKKTFTPAGKRRFKATVLSSGAQAQKIFHDSASMQKMPGKPGEYGVLNRIKQCEVDYRVEPEAIQEKKRKVIKPKKSLEKKEVPKEVPEVFMMTENDFRTER